MNPSSRTAPGTESPEPGHDHRCEPGHLILDAGRVELGAGSPEPQRKVLDPGGGKRLDVLDELRWGGSQPVAYSGMATWSANHAPS